MSFHWSIYCITEENNVLTWSDTEPTTCPNNASHTVQDGSQTIIEVARGINTVLSNQTTASSSNTTLGCFAYQGTTFYDIDNAQPKYLKISAFVDFGSYTIRVIDQASNVLFSSTGNTNTSLSVISFDFDTVSVPTASTVYDIQASTSGGTVTLKEATLYYAMVQEST